MGTERGNKDQDRSDASALQVYEERLKTLLELSSEWYWEQDENHRFSLIVGARLDQMGIDQQEYLGTARWDHDIVPVGDGGSWDHHKAQVEARQPFTGLVYTRVDSQGEVHYISASGRPRFEGQRFVGYCGIARDVTASMRAEQLLRLEHMVARCVAGAESAATALKAVIRSICETQGWECGRYFGRQDESDVLTMNEFWHVPRAGLESFIEQSRELSYTAGAGLIGQVWQSGEPMWVTDIGKDDRIQKGIARQLGMRGTFIFPVVSEGKPIGVLSFHSTKVREPDERLLQAVGVIGSQIGQFVQRKQAEEQIQYLATHDALTGLPNRVMFSQLLSAAIQTARRYQRSFAVLFIDLDRFKFVNDTLGHEAGDRLLQEIAARFARCLRASDVVARFGGDEFVVLVQEANDAEQVATIARKILAAAIKPVFVSGQECRVTASVGICSYPGGAQDEQSLMKNADAAMYLAKEEGKNNFQFYSESVKAQSLERLTLESGLRRALERNEFFLHYQAKLDLRTKQITGVEALLRWQHPELGLVPPARFLPVAEETGMSVAIGRWVLQTACAQNVAWQGEGLPPVCVAVNLSARQFTDADLLWDIAGALEQSGMKPELLELELTESIVMQNVAAATKRLASIKEMGVRIALDDFGMGYASLAQIRRFPIDTLKVDRSFIRDVAENAEDRAITEAIIAMGKTLSLAVVAEGVETQDQQAFLLKHACDAMQGYYFNKPVVHDEFATFLRRHRAGTSS
ncbi:MAG TPA: EAL domain-containing protein [Burkholderiales bacterium]|jgi:diguanylate cyclase (GGDEF)-like protein/PAS domain S-box-containing protein|nr:EAL domain-containing protein [Burkholderiales bacterium]